MVKNRRPWLVTGLAVAAAACVGWVVLRDSAPAVAPAASAAEPPSNAGRGEPDLSRIDLTAFSKASAG